MGSREDSESKKSWVGQNGLSHREDVTHEIDNLNFCQNEIMSRRYTSPSFGVWVNQKAMSKNVSMHSNLNLRWSN